MRKEANFEVTDKILVSVSGNDRISGIMTKKREEILSEVLAIDIVIGENIGYNKKWSLNGENVELGVQKAEF